MSNETSYSEEKSKMSQEPRCAIWKPNVEWIDPSQPKADIENPRSATAHFPRYTQTSLRREASSDPADQLNKLIRETSESHNLTARPFARQTSLISLPLHQEPVQFRGDQSLSSMLEGETCGSQIDQSSIDNKMNQKLVHNQYNSPIGMYSTEAIHKAILAQSEEIAPGVKGFRPAKSPVNMQSEVLKMIREEEMERQKARATSSSTQSKFSQGQVSLTPTKQRTLDRDQSPSLEMQHAIHCNQGSTNAANTSHLGRTVLEPVTNNKKLTTLMSGIGSDSTTGQPKCCECGSSIVGPFAKVENRFVHPHCFNCSTCGSSLKNCGYFSINEKLYCDIHARQVADVMRLNHNFQPDKQPIERVPVSQDKAVVPRDDIRAQPPTSAPVAQSTLKPQQVVGIEHRCSCCNRSTTISSIFSRGGCSSCHRGPTNQIKIYQPIEAQKSRELMRDISTSNEHSSSLNQSCHHRVVRCKRSADQLAVSPTNSLQSKAPVCCNCYRHIHGPYILAGHTVWCKPCSANKFVCSTCHKSLLDSGFIEDSQTKGKYHCESCFETNLMPDCAKCNRRITELECLKALGKTWHTGCFVCAHCKCPFGNSKFYLEDNLPYCERDWNLLFTTKCISCGYPIEAGDKWIEALGSNYHSDCFRCTGCQVKLEGTTFLCKNGKPYCRMHAR